MVGINGLAVPKHVDLGQEAGQGSVTPQLQFMEAETVQQEASSQEFATKNYVQVQHFIFIFSLGIIIFLS